MSIGPLGMIGSAAGSPLAQAQGSEAPRASQGAADQARQLQSHEKAESAAGVGQTEQDEEASDRDADGRRPWELPAPSAQPQPDEELSGSDLVGRGKDPTGVRGTQLDVSG